MGHSLLALLFLLTTVLNAADAPRLSLVVTASAALADVALLLWLTPRYGMTGAAGATTVSLAVGCLVAGVGGPSTFSATREGVVHRSNRDGRRVDRHYRMEAARPGICPGGRGIGIVYSVRRDFVDHRRAGFPSPSRFQK